jgi:transposase
MSGPAVTSEPHRDVKLAELLAIIEQAASAPLGVEDRTLLAQALQTLSRLEQEVKKKGATIAWLRKLLGGKKTEKTRVLLGKEEKETPEGTGHAASTSTGGGTPVPITPTSAPEGGGAAPPEGAPKRPGHGRIPASAYTGAAHIRISHPTLKKGDLCPCGCGGHLYPWAPHISVFITGGPLLAGRVVEKEVLRSDACQHLYAAGPASGEEKPKFDASAKATIAASKYGYSIPFNRIGQMQQAAGVPVPPQTQWDVVSGAAREVLPVYRALADEAAQGDLFHNDDTGMPVLELTPAFRAQEAADRGVKNERTGSHTTAIVSVHQGREIVIYSTGEQHAGENLEDLLSLRAPERSIPMQMCDALDRNIPATFKTLLCNCLAHGRRNFVDILDAFPVECRVLLEHVRQVYVHEAEAKRQGMTPEQRLTLHQTKSGPVMVAIATWMTAQLDGKKVEPNSTLGHAINYMQKRWDKFTCFLRVPGAPLDNNTCERAFKMVVLHRKNAYFYKTLNGAFVGDIFMSLIQTALRAHVSPIEYLTALLKHPKRVKDSPTDWMPWNFKSTLARSARVTAEVT